jgi:ankyrin repeat protein
VQLEIYTEEGDVDAVSRLVAEGADVNVKGTGDSTPLHVAALNGHAEVAAMLLTHGAKVGAINNNRDC